MSFRLEEQVAREIENEANKMGLSVNSYANQALKRQVLLDKMTNTMGCILIPKNWLLNTLDELEPQVIPPLGHRLGSQVPEETMMLLWRKADITAISNFFRLWIDGMNLLTDFDCYEEKGEYHFILWHNLGSKFSKFAFSYIESMITQICNRSAVDIITTENTVRFTINLHQDDLQIKPT